MEETNASYQSSYKNMNLLRIMLWRKNANA